MAYGTSAGSDLAGYREPAGNNGSPPASIDGLCATRLSSREIAGNKLSWLCLQHASWRPPINLNRGRSIPARAVVSLAL